LARLSVRRGRRDGQDACRKDISIDTIARMYRDYLKATMIARVEKASARSSLVVMPARPRDRQ
jgi:hypothetical protein